MQALFSPMKEQMDKAILWLKVHRSQHFSIGIFIAFLFTLLFFLGMVLSPFLIPADTIHFGESGTVGGDDFGDEIDLKINNSIASFYYKMGDLNCHQRESRSWELNGNQLPFCARDTAIFFGLVLGALITLFFVFELNYLLIILAFVPIGLDGGLQLMTSYESNNIMRLITGTIAGAATGVAIGMIILEGRELMRWRKEVKKTSLQKPEEEQYGQEEKQQYHESHRLDDKQKDLHEEDEQTVHEPKTENQ